MGQGQDQTARGLAADRFSRAALAACPYSAPMRSWRSDRICSQMFAVGRKMSVASGLLAFPAGRWATLQLAEILLASVRGCLAIRLLLEIQGDHDPVDAWKHSGHRPLPMIMDPGCRLIIFGLPSIVNCIFPKIFLLYFINPNACLIDKFNKIIGESL